MKEGDSEDDGHLQDAYTLARCIYYSTQHRTILAWNCKTDVRGCPLDAIDVYASMQVTRQ